MKTYILDLIKAVKANLDKSLQMQMRLEDAKQLQILRRY